ncbi:MAG: hypothetical protein V7603_5097 [Micromonosporaceae bacterium]
MNVNPQDAALVAAALNLLAAVVKVAGDLLARRRHPQRAADPGEGR